MEDIVVIKIGGNVIDDTELLSQFLADIAAVPKSKVLIHGGGKIATEISGQLNITPVLIDGRRVTDETALDIVTMVYGGLINKKLVAQLQKHRCNALGLTGADANLIEAHKRRHPTIDYGFVGDIDKINTEQLLQFIAQQITPVIAPLTHDTNGSMLNTNADSVAAAIAIALSETAKVTFIYCFEKKGLLEDVNNDDSVIPHVQMAQIEQLKEKQIITGGMLPKIDNICSALQQGVEKVILCHAGEVLPVINGNAKFGTTFTLN